MIKKDKKAIMVKFLTTLLLAIIIFAPACLFASKFFRLSTQAANNYGNFVSEIDDLMRNGGEGEKRIFLLVMDEETSIVYFESNDFKRRELSSWGGPRFDKTIIGIEVDRAAVLASSPTVLSPSIGYSYGVDFEKPTSCGNKENTACICLLKDFESKFDSTGLGTYTIKPKDAACNELSMRINFSSCGIGSPHKVSEYSCNDGFIIERNLIKKAISSPKDSYFEAPRRVSITMKKEGNVIVLEK